MSDSDPFISCLYLENWWSDLKVLTSNVRHVQWLVCMKNFISRIKICVCFPNCFPSPFLLFHQKITQQVLWTCYDCVNVNVRRCSEELHCSQIPEICRWIVWVTKQWMATGKLLHSFESGAIKRTEIKCILEALFSSTSSSSLQSSFPHNLLKHTFCI